MAANSSSVNTANIITALGNAFKDPSGVALPNERLAAVLSQNMHQLNELAKQGKLNQQQIMQVRESHLMLMAQSYPCFLSTGCVFKFFVRTSYGIMQTSTNPRRQSRCVDLPVDAKGAAGTNASHFLLHTSSLHGTAWSNPSRLLCAFLRLHLLLSLQQPSRR
jgi:hypothetical protein